jgi:hypothetical protein
MIPIQTSILQSIAVEKVRFGLFCHHCQTVGSNEEVASRRVDEEYL